MVSYTRRSVLAGTAGLALGPLAGCLGSESGGPSDTPDVTASFAVLEDVAAGVCGETLDAVGIVPTGQHGHGWQPSAAVQQTIRGSGAFVYVGEGFQPWADDVVRGIEEDDAGVRVVAAREGVDLLPVRTGGAGHGDHHGEEEGHEEGHDGHGGEEHDDHDGHDDHDHGSMDPHFWLDPTRTSVSVGTVGEGLAAAFPDHAETLRANAEAYRTRLAELDEEFESALASRTRDAVLVAGHDAFQYLGERYGFTVHTLTDLSPDDQPTTRDVERARELLDEEGIEYVLAPALESDRAATQLVAETDAVGTLPITTCAGRTEAWADRGWRYPEVMREVNLASLRTALGAEDR